ETAVDIFFVANLDKRSGDAEARRLMSATDSGYISQNIYLYCASQGWGTVVYHGSLDRDKVTTLLGLQPNQGVVGGQSVGRRK
ncbi:MAG: nitroreductase family protein, partial [Rikenellaceae bacterium]|nr:nitroreductase family protein [Rikenellaceae bacterium]